MKKLLLLIINRLELYTIINDFKNIFSTPKIIYKEMDYD